MQLTDSAGHTQATQEHPPRDRAGEVSARDDSTRRIRSVEGNERREDPAKTGQHPLYRELESRRAYPRVQLRLPVQIGLIGGNVVCARIYNLSPDGMQIRCDPGAAKAINPTGRAISPGEGPEVLVAMRLQMVQDMRAQVIRCRVSYVLPESPTEVIIGLTFEGMLAAQREAIDAALSASLMPREC